MFRTMSFLRSFSRRWHALAAPSIAAALFLGCAQGPAAVEKPNVDASSAAAKAVELYDANGDGALGKDELAKCAPLAQSMANYDANNDGRLTEEEISNRLTQLVGPSAAYVTVDGTVTIDRRPLVGATVKLRPADIFEGELPAAEGTTDELGTARPSIPADRLPADLTDAALVYPGLYHVEITHPQTQLPARYNTATELGWEIDPSSRTGMSARFDLTSK